MSEGIVTVFGGTGFLGREIVRAAGDAGYAVRVAARRPPDAPAHASAEHVRADVQDEPSVAAAVDGASAVVNAVSLYAEQRGATFEGVHVDGAGRVARCARAAGIETLVHVSGLGTDPASESKFVRARARGEQAVRDTFAGSIVIRPSVMFGAGDAFLSTLAAVTRLPAVPLFGDGRTRLQPVWVRDVADATVKLVAEPDARRPVIELGGAETATYRRIVEQVLEHLGRRRPLVSVPFPAWTTMAGALAVLPSPPLTRDQIVLMQSDNVVSGREATFADLNIQPAGLSAKLADLLPRPR